MSGLTSSSSSPLTTAGPPGFSNKPTKTRPTIRNEQTTSRATDSQKSEENETPGRKYLEKIKASIKKATVWFVENKDKTLDEILGMALNEQLILMLTFSSLVLFEADPVSQPVEG